MAFDETPQYAGPLQDEDPGSPNQGNSMYLQYGPLADIQDALNPGVEYIDTDSGELLVDTGSSVWLALGSLLIPGMMIDYAGTIIPNGRWLICNGNAVSRTVYADLFAAIGTTWGNGDGNTTFNIPDLRRTVTAGVGGIRVDGPGTTVGDIGGEEQHTLLVTELAEHNHRFGSTRGGGDASLTGTHIFHTRNPDADDDVGINPNAIEVTGDSTPHSNIQPTAIVNKLIRY